MSLENLFSMPVWVHDFEGQVLAEIDAEIDQCWPRLSFRKDQIRHQLLTTFDFNGVNDIVKNDLRTFARHVWDNVSVYFDSIKCPPCDLEIQESWFNRYQKGFFMYDHEHPTGVISGVYYHRAEPEDGGDFYFRNPNPLMLNRMWPGDQLKEYQTYKIEAKTGRLILFPGWLTHSVMPVTGDREKISLSFNLAHPMKKADLGPHYFPS